ncbi:DUF2716 domain-containing protein [Amycolatopsis plumensis]|uniref:DUF2716 domain-containing protein n=1 Tax=Amycolatopsis plumensis TaxID=236508 RepID=A0ABV5UGT5_9PSEU
MPTSLPSALTGENALRKRHSTGEDRRRGRGTPGITEPPGSATWHVGDLDDPQLDALSQIVHKGLRESVEPGEELYWLDWQHVGYRFDPARVDGAGPRRPGAVLPDGDYHLYLTRIGAELTAALGEPVRRTPG